MEKTLFKEAIADPIREREVPEDEPEAKELLDIVSTFQQGSDPDETIGSYRYERGLTYDWGKRRNQVSGVDHHSDSESNQDRIFW
jgi:hypothetical protein